MTSSRQYRNGDLKRLFTTRMAASFAISPTEFGHLVAHEHWKRQQPVRTWADVQRLHDESRFWPCFFDGAYNTLVACDGQPPAALVHQLFGDAPSGPSARDEL